MGLDCNDRHMQHVYVYLQAFLQ